MTEVCFSFLSAHLWNRYYVPGLELECWEEKWDAQSLLSGGL